MKIFLILAMILPLVLSACDGSVAPVQSRPKAQVNSISHLEVGEGEKISLTGKNFGPQLSVLVNGLAVEVTVSSQTAAEFTMPAMGDEPTQSISVRDGKIVVAKFAALDKMRKKEVGLPVKAEELCTDNVVTGSDGNLVRGTRDCGVTTPLCDAEKNTACLSSEDFPAVKKDLIKTSVVAGQSLLGIQGEVLPKPSDCDGNNQTDCVAVSLFPALKLLDLTSEHLVDSLTLFGVTGNLVATAPVCSIDNETACLVTGGIVAVHKLNTVQPNLSKIKSSFSILGLQGTLDNCTNDGEDSCVVVGPNYAAAALSGAQAKILQGQTLAGLSGNAPLRPANCASDGEVDCVAVTDYPAVQISVINANLNKFKTDLSIAQISGTLDDCSSDGDAGCEVVSPNYAAGLLTGASPKIKNGELVAGLTGTAPPVPGNCASDGDTDCVAHAGFPALDAMRSPPKIVSAMSLGGLTGTASGARPLDCLADGETSCVAVSSFPSMRLLGAAAKIAAGVTLGGVPGTAGVRPGDCASDGATLCVTVANFPSIEKNFVTANLNKIHTSVTLVGESGTLQDCSTDGGLGCYAWADYPSAELLGADVKILSGQSVAGITGAAPLRPSNCATEAATSCVTVNDYPALDKSHLSSVANQLRTTFSLQSVGGSLNDCSADGTTNCVTSASFPSADTSGAAAKILSGQSLAGTPGTAGIRPSDCSSDGANSCVTALNYPSVDRVALENDDDKFRPSLSLGGVQGTLADCSSDNQAGCVAIASHPAVVASNVTEGIIKSGTTIAGVAGVYPNSTYPLSVGDGYTDLDTALFNTRVKSSSNFGWFDRTGARQSAVGDTDLAAANIKSGISLYGENGSWVGGQLEAPVLRSGSNAVNRITLDYAKTCCIASGILIVRRADAPVTFTPTNGVDYTAGTDLGSNQTVIVKSNTTRYEDTPLTAGKVYHYKAWTYDSSNTYSSSGTTRYEALFTTTSFGSIDVAGKRWMTKRSNGTDGYPAINAAGEITMIPATNNQETGIFNFDRMVPPFDVDFDFNIDRDGADGFSFSFGKNLGEYYAYNLPASGNIGTLGSTGYAVRFATFNTNRVDVVQLSGGGSLALANVPLESPLNTWIHVKIRVTANAVQVYFNNSGTATLDYTHTGNWTMTYPYVAFGAGSGGFNQMIKFRNIVFTQP